MKKLIKEIWEDDFLFFPFVIGIIILFSFGSLAIYLQGAL